MSTTVAGARSGSPQIYVTENNTLLLKIGVHESQTLLVYLQVENGPCPKLYDSPIIVE